MLQRGMKTLGLPALLAALLGTLFLAAPTPLAAQQGATTGSIVGQVLDPEGQPAADARVIVTNLDRGTTREVLTNRDGRFVVGLLPPGQYRVRAEKPPQPAAEIGPVTVSIGARRSLTLNLVPVEVREIGVQVTGAAGAAANEAGVVDLVSEEQITGLPSPGRDFTDFIALSGLVSIQPGITTGGQFSIGGARTSLTNVQIDGADANNSFFGENRGSSRVPFTFSLESIKEFQVIPNGYDVEYGRYSGGVVNAVTRSGGNDFQGSAFLFWRDEALTTDNFDGTSPADFQAFQFGGTLSGPVVEDELHYFLSGDFQQWDQPTFALTPERSNIPASTINEFKSILVDEYGFDASFVNAQFGTFTETQDQANLFGRLDWTPSQDHRLTLRANYQDFTNENDRLQANGTDALTLGSSFLDESISIVGEWNAVLGDGAFNTFRAQYSNEIRPRPGNSQLPTLQVTGIETREGRSTSMWFGGEFVGITFLNRLEEEKIQITDNFTFRAGDHTLKIGTDNVFTNTFNRFWLFGNGWFLFTGGMDSFRAKSPLFFLRAVPDPNNPGQPPSTDFGTQEWSVYAQDEWQASDRLMLSLGLRWDYTNWADAGEPLADPDLRSAVNAFGVSPTTVPEDTDNFGPRLSFNWDVNGDESEVLRGGFGVFTARTPTVNHSNITLANPRPLSFVFCLFPSTEGYRNWDSPERIPISSDELDALFCSPGDPELSVWDEDFEDATTYKANLGYEHQLADDWRTSAEVIFSRTTNLFGALNINQPADPFFSTRDGRPVWVPEEEDFPNEVDLGTAGQSDDVRALYKQVGNGEARAWNLKFNVQGNPTQNFRIAANYTVNFAFDNNTTECCTSNALLFDTPTAADPNFLGDPGDDVRGSWGPSKTERRHVFVTNFLWSLPADFSLSAIYRAQSGNPFTPEVRGDLNGDGNDGNDRPFLPDPDNPAAGGYAFEASGDLSAYRDLLSEFSCLRESVGSIVSRNTCRDPWWHSVDVKVTKRFRTVGDQSFEVVADFFNVLDGLGIAAGEFTFFEDELFQVEGYDPGTRTMTVSTGDFGREIPVGFEPFQFQAQLGVRYNF